MNFIQALTDKLDFIIMGLVLCSGFFQHLYLKGFKWSKWPDYDSALKTLAVSALVSILYILCMKDPAVPTNWAKYFISYFAATSLYQILLTPFVRAIKKATGQKDDTKDTPDNG